MKQEKQDRRSLRTRHLVSVALQELLEEKQYDAITVGDLLERAGIGRTTFYTHYYDKEDVHTSLMRQHLEEAVTSLLSPHEQPPSLSTLAFFLHVQQRQQIFEALTRSQRQEQWWEEAHTLLSRSIEQMLTAQYTGKRSPELPVEVVAHYLTGALLGLLRWWLKAEMPYSPQQMDALFRQLARDGLQMFSSE
ncbi:TetR family transcriptional regulator [Reticulibacter mediterranei]|uniref:TetR family transcriptional regulator n=1 Tax=Reticulibacter mediterranei TaxID=2778369 RepID=A0A8J3IV08_9CHLR|nr:TetR/AcrR family transcriptional regulator [Reticulibacter mediterranei]GHP01179.1 TetR family transcriptional regulator [Reticulibacter mediterranei]